MTKTALEHSVRLLSKKDYSSLTLQKKLHDKGFHEDEILLALKTLRDKNYLNNQRYKEDKISSFIQRYYGNKYIHQKLDFENLEVNDEEIDNIRDELQLSSSKVIEIIIKKKNIQFKSIEAEKKKNKIFTYLLSRGFDFYTIETIYQD